MDQKTAITLKPDARPKWLSRACKMTLDGKASATELYNIIVSRRFSAGLPERIGRKLGSIIQKNLELFSDKQRRHLSSSEFALNAHVIEPAADADMDDAEPGAGAGDADEAPTPAQRAFAQEQAELEEARQREHEEREADRVARVVEEAARRSRKEAAQREERKRFMDLEAEAASRQQAEKEEARRKKLEEEADDIFARALVPQKASSKVEESHKHHSNGRDCSRSVSAAKSSESPPRRGGRGRTGRWTSAHPGELTGSRAILLNRNFQEDLPHLPRPNMSQRSMPAYAPPTGNRSEDNRDAPLAIAYGEVGKADRARSRERSRRRSRRG